MKQPVRSFAIGLLTAGIIMLVGTFFFDNSTKQAEDLSINEMIPVMEDKGYHVITEEEYISMSVQKDNANQKVSSAKNLEADQDNDKSDKSDNDNDKEEKNSKKKDEKENAKDKDEIKSYTVKIESGVLSSTISEALKSNDIIDDATKFNLYLTDNGYGEKIQLGKFKVNSGMTFKEIAETITK